MATWYWTRSSDGGNQNGQLRLEFTEVSTDLVARTTTYNVKIGIYVNTYQGKNTLFSRVTVNGTNKDYNGSGLWTNNSAKVWKSSSANQFTVTIHHNDDGTSSCSVAIGANPSSSYGKTRIHTAASSGTMSTTFANASGSIVLKTIGAKTYTVAYNANGGSGAPASQTKTYGVDLTLSATIPVRSGFNFLGWATTDTATAPEYQPGGAYTANAAVTLYAVWEKVVTHKARVYTSGEWKTATPHVYHNGAWIEVQEKLDVSGEWV